MTLMKKYDVDQPTDRPLGGVGLNAVRSVKQSVDAEGFFLVRLGTFNCRSTSGWRLPSLTPEQIAAFNDRDKASSSITLGISTADMFIHFASICGMVRHIYAEDTPEGQAIYGWIKPAGPMAMALASELSKLNGSIAFGVRYIRVNEQKLHLISWALLDSSPYSPTSKIDEYAD